MEQPTKLREKLKYLTETETAWLTSISVDTLRTWRRKGKGLPYCKVEGCVRYAWRDVYDYIEKHRIEPGTGGK